MKKLIFLFAISLFCASLFCQEKTYSSLEAEDNIKTLKTKDKKKAKPDKKNTGTASSHIEHKPNSTIVDNAYMTKEPVFTSKYQSFQEMKVSFQKKFSASYNDNIIVHNGTDDENLSLRIYAYNRQNASWDLVDTVTFSYTAQTKTIKRPLNGHLKKYQFFAIEPTNGKRCLVSCITEDHDLYILTASEDQKSISNKLDSNKFKIYDNSRKNFDKAKDTVKIKNNTNMNLTFSVYGAKVDKGKKTWVRIGYINSNSKNTSDISSNFYEDKLEMFSYFSVVNRENKNLNFSTAVVSHNDLVIEIN